MRWVFNGIRTDGYGASLIFAKPKPTPKSGEASPTPQKRRSAAATILEGFLPAKRIPKEAHISAIDMGQINVRFFCCMTVMLQCCNAKCAMQWD